MSNLLQRLAQRGAAPAAATGLAPVLMRPRARFESAGAGLEAMGVATEASTVPAAIDARAASVTARPPVAMSEEPGPIRSTRAELHDAPTAQAARSTAPRSIEPFASALPESPLAPLPPLPLYEPQDPHAPAPPNRSGFSGPLAESASPEPPKTVPEAATPAFAPLFAEAVERPAQRYAALAAEAAQIEASGATPPPTLSIGRLEVQFMPPPIAPAAPVRRSSSGFDNYARIRRGSPR